MRLDIVGGRVLMDEDWIDATIAVETVSGQGRIASASPGRAATATIDATGLLVLPGMIDIHGDTFERIIEPRPMVRFDLELALREADRQLATNGITTAYHAVTWSWEPGLRGAEAAREIIAAIERLNGSLMVDTRIHLRHETFNLEAEAAIVGWLEAGRIGALAFNDHMTGTIKDRHRPEKLAKMVERSGLSQAAFEALVEQTYARGEEVPCSITRLADAACRCGVRALSHDDMTPEQRAWFRERGVAISEFPTTEATAAAAIAAGEATVFGAPNVIRGGSHTGCPAASDMAAKGWCTILASDYYYPAMLLAPFRLAALGVMPLEQAWALVSKNPARALGLSDRGSISGGRRADVILVDATRPGAPSVIATVISGRVQHLSDPGRLSTGGRAG